MAAHGQGASPWGWILRGAAVVALWSAVFGAVTLLRDQLVAFFFGAAGDAESLAVSNGLVSFLVNLAAGILAPVFTPILLRVRRRESAPAAQRFVAEAIGAAVAFSTASSVVLAAASPSVVAWVAPGFDAARAGAARLTLLLLLPAVASSSVAYLLAALLTIERRFALAAFAPTLQPLGAILGALVARDGGVYSMAAGASLGASAQVALLAWTVAKQAPGPWLAWPSRSAEMRQLARDYGFMFLGSVAMGSTTLVNNAMATTLPAGAVAHLAFANVPILLALGLGARVVGQVILPHFAELAAGHEWQALRGQSRRAFAAVFAAATIVAIGLVVLAEPIVRLLFERGAFSAADTRAVAGIERWLALHVPWYIAGIVSARLLTSLGMTSRMLSIAMLGLVLTVVSNLLLMPWLGVEGIAIGVGITYAICFLLSWASAEQRLALLGRAPTPSNGAGPGE